MLVSRIQLWIFRDKNSRVTYQSEKKLERIGEESPSHPFVDSSRSLQKVSPPGTHCVTDKDVVFGLLGIIVFWDPTKPRGVFNSI